MTKQLIHKTYRQMLADICAESDISKRVGNNAESRQTLEKLEDIIYFPNSRKKNSGQYFEEKYLLAGIVTGFFMIVGIFIFNLFQTKPVPIFIPEAKQTAIPAIYEKKAETMSFLKEVDQIKEILGGLIKSVQVLSEKREEQKSSYRFPYPVKVTSEKANLRTSPDFHSNSISVVLKNTILLATAENNAWLLVSTPKGEKAWISKDVVVREHE